MTARDHRRIDEQKDTYALVCATSFLASFISLVIDLRLCAMVAALGVFWVLTLKQRFRQTQEQLGTPER